MLPRKFRTTVREFRKYRIPYIKINTDNFSIYLKKDIGKGKQFIISVPKSLDKRASKRNLTRRLIEQVIVSGVNKVKNEGLYLIRAKKILARDSNIAWKENILKALKA